MPIWQVRPAVNWKKELHEHRDLRQVEVVMETGESIMVKVLGSSSDTLAMWNLLSNVVCRYSRYKQP